jgi:transaldolase
MRIFLDTANIEQIKSAVKLGVISGVTTNPTLVSKENGSYRDLITKICGMVAGPVSAEVMGEKAADMVKEARDIVTWAPNIAIKIPATEAGVEATSVLAKDGIKINFTLCFSLNQALLAALAGAAYVSPFVGRLDDAGHDGMGLVKEIVDVYAHYHLPTQVIAASLRHTRHCVQAAQAGAHIATIPYAVLMQMIRHPLTDVGIERFRKDFQAALKS